MNLGGWDAVPSEPENVAGPLPSHPGKPLNFIVKGRSVVLPYQNSSLKKNKYVGGYSSWVPQQTQALKLYSALVDFRAPQKHWAGVTRDISQTLNLLFPPKMPLVTIIIQVSTSVFLIYLYLTWHCITCQEGNIILHRKWICKKNVFTMSWIIDGFLCQSWHLEV